jgi:citrate synthase
MTEGPKTRLSHHTTDAIFYGEDNLVQDLLGRASFLDVFMKQSFGRVPSAPELVVINAVLVALMEHGMTPSVIAARMVYSSSPENLQAGVAAGLLAVASKFVGTTEDCAVLLQRIAAQGEAASQEAELVAAAYRARRAPVPGFGHHLHKPDDPRAAKLLELASEQGTAGAHVAALRLLGEAVDRAVGRHLTINATGAVAAVLADIGIPPRLMRGFAVLSRTAGLIAHIAEEQRDPSDRFIWDLVDKAMAPT